jgi:o-succinylbenzoate---CoA ligase
MAEDTRLLAVELPAGPEALPMLERLWTAGDAVLPLDADAPAATRTALLERLRPHAVRTGSTEHALPDPLPVPAGTALVVPTSGSTGEPKGVVLSHDALHAATGASLARLRAARGERWLCCLPLFHVAGLLVLLRSRALGTPALVLPRFDVAAVAGAADVQHVAVVPTMLVRLLDAGVDLGRFATVLLGGAAAPASLLARAAAAGARVVTTYGMTETCGGCVYDGVPLDGVRIAVDGDGRIRIGGPTLFDGYHGDPVGTAAVLRDGWLHTADVGRMAGGHLEVLGRADDVISSGGEKVPAAAVEAVLAGHPLVAEVVVLGRPDPEWGQAVVAVVVAAPRTAVTDTGRLLRELRALAAATLPRSHAPRDVVVVDALPLLGSGKPDRGALQQLIGARRRGSAGG